jgi:hypothetical protein
MSDTPQITHYADPATLARLIELGCENDRLRDQIVALRHERDIEEQQHREIEQKMRAQRNVLGYCEDAATEEVLRLRAENAALREALVTAKDIIIEDEAENAALKVEVAVLQVEKRTFWNDDGELRAENAALKAVDAGHLSRIDGLKTRVELLTSENDALKAERDNERRDRTRIVIAKEREIHELKAEVLRAVGVGSTAVHERDELKAEVERLISLLRMTTQDSIDGSNADHEEAERLRALLREQVTEGDIIEEYSGTDGSRDWAKYAQTWIHPGEAVVLLDIVKIRAALGEGGKR